MLEVVHASLEKRDLLPSEHLVDKGYTDSEVFVRSERDYGVSITGPVADDPSWQARAAEGFEHSQFHVDWDRQVVTCPQGKESFSFLPSTSLKNGRAEPGRRASPGRTARPVPTAPSARGRRRSPASSGSCRATSTRRCRRHADGRRQRSSRSDTPLGQVSRPRTSRRSGAVGSVTRATSAKPKCTSNTGSQRRRTTSCGWRTGWRARPPHRPGALSSPGYRSPPETRYGEFATSVNVGFTPSWPAPPMWHQSSPLTPRAPRANITPGVETDSQKQ